MEVKPKAAKPKLYWCAHNQRWLVNVKYLQTHPRVGCWARVINIANGRG